MVLLCDIRSLYANDVPEGREFENAKVAMICINRCGDVQKGSHVTNLLYQNVTYL